MQCLKLFKTIVFISAIFLLYGFKKEEHLDFSKARVRFCNSWQYDSFVIENITYGNSAPYSLVVSPRHGGSDIPIHVPGSDDLNLRASDRQNSATYSGPCKSQRRSTYPVDFEKLEYHIESPSVLVISNIAFLDGYVASMKVFEPSKKFGPHKPGEAFSTITSSARPIPENKFTGSWNTVSVDSGCDGNEEKDGSVLNLFADGRAQILSDYFGRATTYNYIHLWKVEGNELKIVGADGVEGTVVRTRGHMNSNDGFLALRSEFTYSEENGSVVRVVCRTLKRGSSNTPS